MKTLKQILAYTIWIAMALLLGICHMYIVLGPRETGSNFLQVIGNLFYDYALVHVGVYVGAVIGVVFILTNIFFLKKKLKQNKNPTIIRFVVLLSIAVIVGITHYILEKVIDVI